MRIARDAAVLELRDVSKYREQGGIGFELEVPHLILPPGSFVSLVGESGCGKSTLLDLLALVIRPNRCGTFRVCVGREPETIDVKALWDTEDESGLASLRRNYLGYVLQAGGLFPFLTVAQNIVLPAQIRGLADYEKRIKGMAERMGVSTLLRKKPQYLSGGQRQRVAVLRALANDPLIVLADEPAAAVDRQRALSIVRDFRALATEEGSTIVMATHDHELIKGLADTTYTFRVEAVSKTLTRSVCLPVS
ncbi:MAG: ABC transporter ATP-binding protein [Nitrospinota bacterium]